MATFTLRSDKATVPTRGSAHAAGYDLYAAEDAKIEPLCRQLIMTNLSVTCPPKHYARIAPRSGLAYRSGINVLAGVIDEDYTGDVGVILHNTGTDDMFKVTKGDRIAQLIFTPYHDGLPVRVVEEGETKTSAGGRGDKGFGSTGK